MKLSNITVGQRIQAKESAVEQWSSLVAGEVYTVLEVDCVREHLVIKVPESVHCFGRLHINSRDFRKYKVSLEVGDHVLVGAEGAGWYHVEKDYAGKVCVVQQVFKNTVEICHPTVHFGVNYRSHIKYLTKVAPNVPFKAGDVLRCIHSHESQDMEDVVRGRLYEYHSQDERYIFINDPEFGLTMAACDPEHFELYTPYSPAVEWVPSTDHDVKVGDTLKIVYTDEMTENLRLDDEVTVIKTDTSCIPFHVRDCNGKTYWLFRSNVHVKVEKCTNPSG